MIRSRGQKNLVPIRKFPWGGPKKKDDRIRKRGITKQRGGVVGIMV